MNVARILSRKTSLFLIVIFTCVFGFLLVTGNKTQASNDVTWQLASTGLPGEGTAFAAAFGDFNNDGKTDLVAGHGDTGIQLWPNDGTPTWGTAIAITDTGRTYGLAAGDINLDGLLDVVSCDGNHVYAFTQDGVGGWEGVILPGEITFFLEINEQFEKALAEYRRALIGCNTL